LILGALFLACAAAPLPPPTDPTEPPAPSIPVPDPAANPLDRFADRRIVSADGRRYALLLRDRNGGPPTFAILRRPPGAPAVVPLEEPAPWDSAAIASAPPVTAVSSSDPVEATGVLPFPCVEARVLDGAPALLLFEHRNTPGRAEVLALLDGTGVRWSLRLADLLPPDIVKSLPSDATGVAWSRGWWADEDRGEVILVTEGLHLRRVVLRDGSVTEAAPAVVLHRIEEGPEADRRLALEVALDLPPDLRPAGLRESARAAMMDATTPISVAVRAALVTLRIEEAVPAEAPALARRAVAAADDLEARAFATLHLAELLPRAEALTLLEVVLGGEPDISWRAAMAALAGIGEEAVPLLRRLLRDRNGTLDSRGGAAHVLGYLKATAALEDLWLTAQESNPEVDPHDHVSGAALEAMVSLDTPELRVRLLQLLRAPGPHHGTIASWFSARPGEDAIAPLLGALERAAPFHWSRKPLLRALRLCSNRDIGDDPAAWRQAFPTEE
jgi:hypothetical protein